MKTLMLSGAAVLGLMLCGTTTANASGFGIQIGGSPYGYGYAPGSYYYGGFYSNSRPRSHWHNTGHWDYYPGGVYRHRNHYHHVPGHYDWHDTSHRHRGHGGRHHHH